MEDLNKLIKDNIKKELQQSIVGPDYSKRTKITFNNKSYTVSEDGYIQIMFVYTTGVDWLKGIGDNVYINGTIVYKSNMTVYWSNSYSHILPVKKGDIVTYSETAQVVEGYYFPIRF